MALAREQVSDGLLSELDHFEQLIRPLSDEQWAMPSRCAGWTVGDVARHTVGSIADVAAGQLDGLGTEAVTAREVAERQGRSAAELADECAEVRKAAAGLLPVFDDEAWVAAAPGGYEGTLGDGVEALWFDTWMHGNDIRSALGTPAVEGPAMAGGLSHVCFELRKRGKSDAVVGDPYTWLLVATGRAEPSLIGEGAPFDIYGS
jgi:uncharacterized protein (TIGR03083 family)